MKTGLQRPDYDCRTQEFFHLSLFLHERIQEFDTGIWVNWQWPFSLLSLLSSYLLLSVPCTVNYRRRVRRGGIHPRTLPPWISNRQRCAFMHVHRWKIVSMGMRSSQALVTDFYWIFRLTEARSTLIGKLFPIFFLSDFSVCRIVAIVLVRFFSRHAIQLKE